MAASKKLVICLLMLASKYTIQTPCCTTYTIPNHHHVNKQSLYYRDTDVLKRSEGTYKQKLMMGSELP